MASLAEFCVEWFVKTFGTRHLASSQLTSLVAGVRKHAASDVRVRTFSRLCSLSEDGHLDASYLSFFLRGAHLTLSLEHGSAAFFASDSSYLISLERAMAVVHTLFGPDAGADAQPESENKLREALINVPQQRGKNAGSVDIDDLLAMLIDERVVVKAPPRVRGNLLTIFAAADADADGWLRFDELKRVYETQYMSEFAAGQDWKAMCALTGPQADGKPAESITPAAFVELCGPMAFTMEPAPEPKGLEPEERAVLAAAAAIADQWITSQKRVAETLRKLRVHVEEVDGRYQMSAHLLRLAHKKINDLLRGLSMEQIEGLDDVLRRGMVAIELERAGGIKEEVAN